MPKTLGSIQFLSHLRQNFSFVWATQAYFTISLISLEFLRGIFPVGTAWVTKQIFDELGQPPSIENSLAQFGNRFFGLLIFQIALTLTSSAIALLSSYLNNELNRRLNLRTEAETYGQMLRLKGLAYFENPKYHQLFQLASHGLQTGTSQVIQSLTTLIQSIVTFLSFLGVIFFLNPIMLLLLLVANLPRLYGQLRFGQQRVFLKRELNSKERLLYYFSHILSNVHFAKEIRLFSFGNYILENLLGLKRDVHKEQRKQELREIRTNLSLNLLSAIVTTMIFAAVIYQAYLGKVSIGDVMFYTAALGSISLSIERTIQVVASMNEQVLFFQHYTEFQALKPDLPVVMNPRPVPPLSHRIELRNLSFRYTDDSPYILKNINLFIPAKRSLALVGLNGSGKTTLVKLLTRLYDPTEGQILWDGIDIREFDVEEFRQRISTIFQDFVRYDLTARENIGLGDVSVINKLPVIQRSAVKTGMHEYIESLPKQYETILSRWLANEDEDQGTDLSGGQWQKIAISRMLMRDADFMILDEPTATLDAEAEYEIFSQFSSLVANRASLLISHRFSTVRIADHIAVLENGEIIEYGSHEELIVRNGKYTHLYAMQVEQYLNVSTDF